MRIGLTNNNFDESNDEALKEFVEFEAKRKRFRELRELEEAEARMATKNRRAKKAAKVRSAIEAFQEYSTPRNTGSIDWVPVHSSTKERWDGTMLGKKVFKIEAGIYIYNLKIINPELVSGQAAKLITETSFEKAAKKAESIMKNYLKLLKKKKE